MVPWQFLPNKIKPKEVKGSSMHHVGGFSVEAWSTKSTKCLGVGPGDNSKGQSVKQVEPWVRWQQESGAVSYTVESGRCQGPISVYGDRRGR